MKRKSILLILLSILLCFVLAACGESGSKKSSDDDEEEEEETLSEDDFVGTWEDTEDDSIKVVFDDGGEGVFTLWGDDYDISWKLKNEKVTFKADGVKYTCTINKKGKLKVEGEGVGVTLEKQKASNKKQKTKKDADDEDDDDDDDSGKTSKKNDKKNDKDDEDIDKPEVNVEPDDDDKQEKPKTSSAIGSNEIVGYYRITEMEQGGQDMKESLDLLNQYNIYMYFVINDDGTAYMDMMGETQNLYWNDSVMWGEGETEANGQPYTYKNDKITIEAEGVKMVCQRLTASEQQYYEEHGSAIDEDALMEMYNQMQ